VRGVSNNLGDFPVAMLDYTYVATFTWDDNNSADWVLSVFLFLYFTLHLAVCQTALNRFYCLLIALVGLVRVDDHFHEIGE